MILATFVSSRLPILATDNVRQFWQLMILANFGNFGQEPPLHCFGNVSEAIPCPTLIPCLCFFYPPSFRRIKNAIIGNQTKKSSFMLLGVIPRLVEWERRGWERRGWERRGWERRGWERRRWERSGWKSQYSCYVTYVSLFLSPPFLSLPPHRLVTLIEEENSGTDLISEAVINSGTDLISEAVITLGSFAHGRTVPGHFTSSTVDIERIEGLCLQ